MKIFSIAFLMLVYGILNAQLNQPSKPISELSKEDLKGLEINNDNFKEITFVHVKNITSNRPYLSLKNGFSNIRLVVKYSGKNWIFFKKVIFLSGGKKIEVNDLQPTTEVGNSYVYERADFQINNELYDFFKEAIKSNNEILFRLVGDKSEDSKFTNSEIKAFIKIFDLYEKLKI